MLKIESSRVWGLKCEYQIAGAEMDFLRDLSLEDVESIMSHDGSCLSRFIICQPGGRPVDILWCGL